MTLYDLATGVACRANAATTWALGSARRARLEAWFADKYTNQPYLFGLAVTWLAFASVPTAVFAGYLVFWVLLALGVFMAILLFWAGLGLLLFVPALLLATGLAVLAFAWVAVSVLVVLRVAAVVGVPVPFVRSDSAVVKAEDKTL